MDLEDPDDPTTSARVPFVDRIPESQAMREALEQHRSRIDRDLVDTKNLRNVLTFYGEGGYGKTELSRQLATWITGGGEQYPHQWGTAPRTPVDAVVRWDVNDSRGELDPLALLIGLRSQLGAIKPRWPPFDLAFAALHRVLRPGQELRFRAPKSGSTTLSDVLAGLTADLVTAADIAVAGGVSAGVFGLGRSVLVAARDHVQGRKTLNEYPRLDTLLSDCETVSGSIEETAEVAGRIAFMLTREIKKMPPASRPIVVVFVDHMERLQVAGERHLGEATLNRLVARLPFFLFVITGRNSLRWHEQITELEASGGHVWPLLQPEHPPTEEPRQHLIGNLSPGDAEEFLRRSLARIDVSISPGLIEDLARATNGWPLHLQMIVGLARERAAMHRPLPLEDLGGPIDQLVERLLSDYPHAVADAFRAACLLPYFDIPFVAAAAEVKSGAVEQLVRRQIVQPNEGSTYPYRIHDTTRALVRGASADVAGGWADADWRHHASLALTESKRRFDQAIADGDDSAAIHSLALGLNVATENDSFDPWLVDAIRRSPTVQGLAPLIAADPDPGASPDLKDTLAFLSLRSRARLNDVTETLRGILERRTAIASSAGLWRAYDLRARGHIVEAIDQLEMLLRDFRDRPDLYRNQIISTLRMNRQYQDAVKRLDELTDAQQEQHRSTIDRMHGRFAGAAVRYRSRVRGANSRRFQVELTGNWLVIRNREGGVSEDEVREVHATAVQVGHLGAQAQCIATLATLHLFDSGVFADCVRELEQLCSRRFQPYAALPEIMALRAWVLSDDALATNAHEVAERVVWRSDSWIPVEILLEDLEHPLQPVDTQWLEPYEVVRDRWLGIFSGLAQRADERV